MTKKLQFFLLKYTLLKPYDMVAILVRVRTRRAYTNSIPITKTISKSNLQSCLRKFTSRSTGGAYAQKTVEAPEREAAG